MRTSRITGESRSVPGCSEPVFVIADDVLEIELSHEVDPLEPAAEACERLAAALLAHAALIRQRAGSPRRTAYVFPPGVVDSHS